MRVKKLEETVTFPEGVTATLEADVLTVKGAKGEVTRQFKDVAVQLALEGNAVKIFAENATRRQKRIIGTFKSHIRNMGTGVTEGYTYKLKVCSGHFPMNVSFNNGEIVVKNFIGEKVPRSVQLPKGVDVKVEGDTITIEGVNKEDAGQAAASIEQLTRRPGFDTRIFQAGIYIIEKAGKSIL